MKKKKCSIHKIPNAQLIYAFHIFFNELHLYIHASSEPLLSITIPLKGYAQALLNFPALNKPFYPLNIPK